MPKYDLIIGSDHAGYNSKTKLIDYLVMKNYKIKDVGTTSTDPVDYPDVAKKVVEELQDDCTDKALLICNTGIGMSIAANRFSGIRAALCVNSKMAKLSREHNDANILVIGSSCSSFDRICKMVEIFLTTEFKGGRHITRLEKIG